MIDSINPAVVNQAPTSVRFIETINIPTGRDATVGSAKKFPAVANDITSAHIALERTATKVRDIARDETRPSDPEKHDAVRTVANQTNAVLAASKSAIEAKASELTDTAKAEVLEHFAPNPNRAGIESEIRAWIRDKAKEENGIAEIRKAMNDDPEIASVISHSPAMLLNIAPDAQQSLRRSAIERHLPSTWEKFKASIALEDLAPKYDKAMFNVRSLYIESVADRVATRANLND